LVFDTSAAAQAVAVTLNLSDNLAGISFANDAQGSTNLRGVSFRSPSGQQFRSTFSGLTLVAGTPLNGTWQGTALFPRFSEGGTWSVEVSIKDGVNNSTGLTGQQLAARGLPGQITIFQPTQTPDGTLGSGGGTVTDTVFGSRASMTFPPGALGGNTNVAIDVLSSALGLPTPQGFTAGTLFVNVSFAPTPAMPFPAPGITLTLPIATFKAPGALVHLYRLDPVTGLLVPATSVTGTRVVGRVNTDGFSATFTGVARFSTLVGFIPTGEPGDVDGNAIVNCADLAIVKASLGKRTGQLGFDSRADVNGNGVVDISDLALVSRALPAGSTCP
jgi:hypothetical protein